ncbi:MAG: zinc-binding dehydrogenase [Planctomycetota bacterium]
MKAALISEHGSYDRIEFVERPIPEPGPREVRVRIRAAGLNHLDTWVRRGVPGHQFPLPLIPGSDGAGIVDALGPGTVSGPAGGVEEGDEVVVFPGTSCGRCAACLQGDDNLCRVYGILGETRDGTCAQYVVVPEANLRRKPGGLSFEEAASMPLVFQTSWSMLVRKARLKPGETVLVQAGASGVGSAAIQIARQQGARVIATAGGEEKQRLCTDLGAEAVIDYRNDDVRSAVKAWLKSLPGRPSGVDVVFEHVGQDTFETSVNCLARGGRLVTCGATTGGDVRLSLHQVFFKNLEVLGNTMGTKGDLHRVHDLIEQGVFRPVVGRVLGFDELREAHRLLEERAVVGKVVVGLP